MIVISFLISSAGYQSQNEQGHPMIRIENPLGVIRPQSIPGSIPFVITFCARDIDINAVHQVRVIIVDPYMQEREIVKTNNLILGGTDEDNLPREYQGFIANVNVSNYIFESAGIHRIIIEIDNEQAAYEIPVFMR